MNEEYHAVQTLREIAAQGYFVSITIRPGKSPRFTASLGRTLETMKPCGESHDCYIAVLAAQDRAAAMHKDAEGRRLLREARKKGKKK